LFGRLFWKAGHVIHALASEAAVRSVLHLFPPHPPPPKTVCRPDRERVAQVSFQSHQLSGSVMICNKCKLCYILQKLTVLSREHRGTR
jgi:hypothetical protein